MESEKPARAIGQRWRSNGEPGKEITITDGSADHWSYCLEGEVGHDGFIHEGLWCCWMSDLWFEGATFLGWADGYCPQPPISAGGPRPKPATLAVGQRWKLLTSGHIHTITRIAGEHPTWPGHICFDSDLFKGWIQSPFTDKDWEYLDDGPAPTEGAATESLSSSAKAAPAGSDFGSSEVVPWPEPVVGSKWQQYQDGERSSAFITEIVSSDSDGFLMSRTGRVTVACFVPGGAVSRLDGAHYEYIPHGWDYSTKQPRAHATPKCGWNYRLDSGADLNCRRETGHRGNHVHGEGLDAIEWNDQGPVSTPARNDKESPLCPFCNCTILPDGKCVNCRVRPSTQGGAATVPTCGALHARFAPCQLLPGKYHGPEHISASGPSGLGGRWPVAATSIPRIVGKYNGSEAAERIIQRDMKWHNLGQCLIDSEAPAKPQQLAESRRYPMMVDIDGDIPDAL